MKVLTLMLLVIGFINDGCTQTSTYAKFIDSFPVTNKNAILRFGEVVAMGPKMTKKEALSFVYDNDSTKLYCQQKIFNMETETVEGISRELFLPQKCLKIKTDKFILVGYSTFDCQDPDKFLKQFLTFNIVDVSNFSITDSLVVYTGNDYGSEITGIVNTQNNKIFILKEMGAQNYNRDAFIYKINDGLKFEIERQQSNVQNMTDNFEKDIELLGWKAVFLN